MKERLSAPKQIRFTEATNKQIDDIANELKVPYSKVIRMAVDEFIRQYNGQKAIDSYISQNKGSETANLLEAFNQFVFDVQALTNKQ